VRKEGGRERKRKQKRERDRGGEGGREGGREVRETEKRYRAASYHAPAEGTKKEEEKTP
jgi:hypothetical protein